MNFFKRARTPEELVLKCCNAYEELAKTGSTAVTRQAVRSAQASARRCVYRRRSRPAVRRLSTMW